jgi:hypothetical protein
MKLIPIFLIIFWIIIIAAPEILAYLLWGLFIFLWLNGLILWGIFKKASSKWKTQWDDYVQFGKYKIFK